MHFESNEHAMYVAARANALDNLLADVAALGEVQHMLLAGLLRQVAFAKIDSIARHPARGAIQLKRVAAGWLCSRGD